MIERMEKRTLERRFERFQDKRVVKTGAQPPEPWHGPLRAVVTAAVLALLAVWGASGCEQGVGDRCQVSSDCKEGLECCGADTKYENTCRKKCNPCGDGVLDEGEMCDDGNTVSGDGCRDDCASDERCGNGVVDNHSQMEVREECDPPGSTQRCDLVGNFQAGEATCTDSCMLDLSNCEVGCGNGVLEEVEQGAPEECDGTDLGGLTCSDLGFVGGELACAGDCTLDLSGCTGGCGNGVVEVGESCDGENLDSMTCTALGFAGGTLACTADCTWSTVGCEGLIYDVLSLDATATMTTVTGDTTDGADILTASCQPEGGAEQLFQIEVGTTGYYLFTTLPREAPTALTDTVLSLVLDPQTPADSIELACNDSDGAGRHGALAVELDPNAQAHYLVVEGQGGSEGAFELLMRKIVTPSGTCAAPVDLAGAGTYGVLIDWSVDGDAQTGTCVGGGSPEAVVRYTAQTAGDVTIAAESIGGAPFGLYVRSGACDETGGQEFCLNGSYAAVQDTVIGLSVGQQLYIIIESNAEDGVVPVILHVAEDTG